jgi:hypothetical protein
MAESHCLWRGSFFIAESQCLWRGGIVNGWEALFMAESHCVGESLFMGRRHCLWRGIIVFG